MVNHRKNPEIHNVAKSELNRWVGYEVNFISNRQFSSLPRKRSKGFVMLANVGEEHVTNPILVPRARRLLVTCTGRLQIKPSGSGDENGRTPKGS